MVAPTSVNGSTVTRPSSTVPPRGSASGATRMPNGSVPARGSDARGGANTIRVSPSAPGNSDRDGGSTRAQPAVGPTTVTSNRSTIEPVFRRRSKTTAWPPGWTVTVVGTRLATTPTSEQSSERPKGCRYTAAVETADTGAEAT